MADKGKTILLVDDFEIIRTLNEEVLRRHGYTVLTANYGNDALRISREHAGNIDLLLTDVKMPGMNGRELADQIQALRPEIKVLYVSGARDATVSKLNTDTVNFLAKPFTPDALVAKVNSLFQT
jgi:two-component system cell cycle sensor histidine kinase/response regulator CckA